MSLFSFSKSVIASLFRRPATRDYPVHPRAPFPRTRGHIANDIDTCIFCGMCARKCPTDAIDVSKPETLWAIDRLRCIQCNCCVEVCPVKCLTMENAQTRVASGEVKDMLRQEKSAEAGS